MIQDMTVVESFTLDANGLLHAERSEVIFKGPHRILVTPDYPPVIACISCGRVHQIDHELYASATPKQQSMMRFYCLGEIVSHSCDEASLDIVQNTAQQYIGRLATDGIMEAMNTEVNQELLNFSEREGRRHIHER